MNSPAQIWARPQRLARRQMSELLFRAVGISALSISVLSLLLLLGTLLPKGLPAFRRTEITAPVFLDPELLGTSTGDDLSSADFVGIANSAIYQLFPEVTDRRQKKALRALLSPLAEITIRDYFRDHPSSIGTTIELSLPLSSNLDQLHKGLIDRQLSETQRGVSDVMLEFYDRAKLAGKLHSRFNWCFFENGDSRYPEYAGIGGSILGSFFTLLVFAVISVPLGVAASLYLEEFAPRTTLTYFINVNISNLAAVPSIIFGLLGLAIVINTLGLPRGTPIVGGIVLSLMVLPTIIIASRSAIASVPDSLKAAALALGASKTQVVFQHVLPAALPGILTGTIVGLSRALGETAPLLMVGMVAFVVDIPLTFTDSASALPVQIYLWAESAERGFVEKTSAAILVILFFLLCMNAIAVILRNKYEHKW